MAPSQRLSAKDAKRARDLAQWVQTEGPKDGMDLEWARGEARHLLLALKPRRRPRREQRAPGRSRDERRKERRERLASVREVVMSRLGGKCEVCAERPATDAHHVEGGGLRQHRETADLMLALCRECHREIHAGDVGTLGSAEMYCRLRKMERAANVLQRRWEKAVGMRAERAGGERP